MLNKLKSVHLDLSTHWILLVFTGALVSILSTHLLFQKSTVHHRSPSSPVNEAAPANTTPSVPVPYDTEMLLTPTYPSSDPINDTESYDALPYSTLVREVSRKTGIEPALILAVAKTESNFRPHAESHAGAVGLMQVIAEAAGKDAWQRVLKKEGKPSRASLKDPYTNLLLGAAYLKLLREHYFKSVKDEKLRDGLVLAAYNWGVGNVKRMLSKGVPRTMDELHWSLWQRAPRETYAYVKKVLKEKHHYHQKLRS